MDEEDSLFHELQADQAQAELEAALKAAAAANGAHVDISWIHTGAGSARLWMCFDVTRRRRKWVLARAALATLCVTFYAVISLESSSDVGAAGLFGAAFVWLLFSWKIDRMPVATHGKIVADATALMDRFTATATRRTSGSWAIDWEPRQTS